MKKLILASALSMAATFASAAPVTTPVPWHLSDMSDTVTIPNIYGGTYYIIVTGTQNEDSKNKMIATVDCGDGTGGTISVLQPFHECLLYAQGGKFYNITIKPTQGFTGYASMYGQFTTSLNAKH